MWFNYLVGCLGSVFLLLEQDTIAAINTMIKKPPPKPRRKYKPYSSMNDGASVVGIMTGNRLDLIKKSISARYPVSNVP